MSDGGAGGVGDFGGAATLNIGARNASSLNSNGSFGDLFVSNAWDRNVPALHRNYWQLFAPLPRRIWVPSAGAGGISGTVAYTNAADTSAAAGTTTVVGTLARTNAADTSAASGTTTVLGTLARTNAADTSAASGTTTIVGTSATTNAADTCNAAGTVGSAGSTGTVSVTNANDAAVAAGATTIVGALAQTNAADTAAAAGWAGTITGTLAYTNRDDTVEARGVAVADDAGGGWAYVPIPRRRTRKELLEERVALGILPAAVIAELPAPVVKQARKVGTIRAADLFGKAEAAAMSTLDLEIAIQRIKRTRRRRQDEELLLM